MRSSMRSKLVILIIAVMALTASSCHININNKPAEEKKQEEQPESAEVEQIEKDILESVVPPEDFDPAGEYEDETSQRAHMEITPDGEDSYQVEIMWGSSAAETTVWTFSGTFDWDGGLLSYKNCEKSVVASDGSNQKETIEYSDGSGALGYYENGFRWQDNKENAGKDCHFVKTGDLDNVAIEEDE